MTAARIEYVTNFNPHPHTEGDQQGTRCICKIRHFNPHPHTEGDLLLCMMTARKDSISIHTLTLRVTPIKHLDFTMADTFQSTPSH